MDKRFFPLLNIFHCASGY